MVLKAGGHSLELLFGLCTVFQTQHEAASPGLSPGHQDRGLTQVIFSPPKPSGCPLPAGRIHPSLAVLRLCPSFSTSAAPSVL